ncbi:Golgi SNAP receptor complex member 1-1 isoform X2 [Daucus carota subsp. sativus]|uniref:Golgi SNAP receptor complex member 1-1 isoform X2 n=1 Tax=Daucus carota subsp. sativus TaxID=79200 RepID=UPI0007EF273B|nr:PREDICTED: Golgi SNAP receptor complex member 1-1 isoform X2 [Daucus carota subsp. sativus]
MDPPTSWDSLRKQARRLEAQLDDQMHLYRKLVSKNVGNGNENDLEAEIDQLLKQLQLVNSQMQAWVSSGGSEIFSHTLTRHQEILHDLNQEFMRLRSSLRANKEHASLLEDFREFDRARLDLEEGGSYEQASLLKERAAISRGTGQSKPLNMSVNSQSDIKQNRGSTTLNTLEGKHGWTSRRVREAF